MKTNETKKSHKRPKYSIKPRSPVLPGMQTTGAGAHKDKKKDAKNGVVKHKKHDYAEHLERALETSLLEHQDMMAGVGMGNYRADEGPGNIKVLRMGDEWQVHIAGKILRISTDEASDREEAVAIAKNNLGMSEDVNWANAIPPQKATNNPNPEFDTSLSVGDRVVHKAYGPGTVEHKGDKFIRVHFDNPHARLPDHRTVSLQAGTVNKAGSARIPIKKDDKMESWTHDTLAALLFEQELTYEDRLNGALRRKLDKK